MRDNDDEEELLLVEQELESIEQEIEVLFARQSHLQDRRRELQRTLYLDDSEEAASGNGGGGDIEPAQDWKAEFPWTNRIQTLLHERFRLEHFRSVQQEVINATLSKRDAFVIMRSGGGKSLCYQLPALFHENGGFTVVISPLLSLIQDQAMLFNAIAGDGTAEQLCGDQPRADATRIHRALIDLSNQTLKLLLVTPEKLIKSKLLMSRLEKAYQSQRLVRFVIDEAHCCSQWGHDFRSDYSKLGILKRQFPNVPILALTATATPHLVSDVKAILEIPRCVFFRTSFFRSNLYYELHPKPVKEATALATLVTLVQSFDAQACGIVYCLTRKETEVVTQQLQSHGVTAACYHANVANKHATHTAWVQNHLQVVVATIAFGLGINKPDVRFVIHYTVSKSMEGYYQESGRAGRDGAAARCVLLYRPSDVIRVCNIVHAETGGMRNLRLMIEYSEELTQCRHAIMAKYFEEDFDATTMCRATCDNCKTQQHTALVAVDYTEHTKAMLAVLSDAKRLERRLTMKQLVDELKTKKVALEWPHIVDPSLASVSRDRCERLIIHLLVKNVLAPEISYTAYNTICYLVPGAAHRRVLHGQLNIVMQQLPKQQQQQVDEDDDCEEEEEEEDTEPLSKAKGKTKAKPRAKNPTPKKRKMQEVELEVIDISE